MEPEFDKEIDALLRRESAGRTITISEFAGGLHLDADEITAFAENKVPPGVRGSFIEHFAECDRCRKILLNAAWLNSETVPEEDEAPVIAAPAAVAVPWYRRLFLFPNLAYVMGGLIVLFAGFIGLSVYSGLNNRSAVVSQTGTSDQAPAASATVEPRYAANSNTSLSNSTTVTANTTAPSYNTSSAANTAANASSAGRSLDVAAQPTPAELAKTVPRREEALAERQSAAPAAAAPPPPAKPKDEAATLDGVITQRQMQKLPLSDRSAKELELARTKPQSTPEAELKMRAGRAPAPVPSGAGAASKKADSSANTSASRKQVQGRTFEFRQGAWYDVSYRGQGTVNVRRNTPEYHKLDVGLRGIAESFVGTVITIWNGRAYRIQ